MTSFKTLRWRPIVPGGVPHYLTEDDVYGEYTFPKGTMFFANTWDIHQDKAEYEEPAEFIPERYLGNMFGCKGGDSDDNSLRRSNYGFGVGRRMCSGQILAHNSMVGLT